MFAVKDDALMVGLSDLDFVKLSGVISSVFKSVQFGEKAEVSRRELTCGDWRRVIFVR